MIAIDPWKRTSNAIQQHYVQHPDLIRSLLERIGAQQVEADGGKGFRCACPLHHGDNDQAFAVWIDNGYIAWRCHTRCAATGNLVMLLMRKYQARRETAISWLARFAGIEFNGPILQVSNDQIQDESIEQVLRGAGIRKEQPVVFDESWVAQSRAGLGDPRAATAIQFLTAPYGTRTAQGDKCRQFAWPLLDKFEVGFVPGNQWVIPDPKDPSQRCGWFEDRIAIPWRASDGHCIGFAGRRIDGQNYLKYKTFTNTRTGFALYGLHHPETKQAIIQTKEVILVEGYTDVWRGWSHGVHNIVAVGGTELTTRKISLLMRFDPTSVVLYFDGDEAGIRSSRRMADQLERTAKVRLAHPPAGLDPDDLLTRDEFLRPIEVAKPV